MQKFSTHCRRRRSLMQSTFLLRAWFRIVLTLCLTMPCFLLYDSTRAQNFSNLQGKELTLVNGSDIIAAGLGRLFGGKIDGKVNHVTVIDDRERRLVIKIAYTGLGGTKLTAEVQGSDKRAQRQVHSLPLTLNNGPAEVELTVEMNTDVSEGTAFESAFLSLSVAKPGKAAGLNLLYSLPKRWQVAIRPENLVLQVTPRAEGSAASLPATEPAAPPIPPRVMMIAAPLPATMAPRLAATSDFRVMATAVPTPTPVMTARTVDTAIILRKTDPALQALKTTTDFKTVDTFSYGVARTTAPGSAQPRGPGATPIRVLERINSSVDVPANQVTKLSPIIYQDQNPSSGIFYYLPQAYHVYWDADQSYAMKFLFGEASSDGEAGEVLMSAVMDTKVSNLDRNLSEQLLRQYARSHSMPFTELRQLPIDEAPKVSLAGDLAHQYNIPADKIVVHSISDVLGQIKVSWVTDPRTKQFMKLALTENVGLNGTVSFKPSGDGLRAVDIPVEIKLADAATFGEQLWKRGERMRNKTPYPMRLKYLHAMLLVGGTPTVYSWNLGDTEVPPQAQAEINHALIPAWLDGRAVRMWIDYRPVKECEPCDERVFETITNGVGDVASSKITFRTITPLADTRAYEIALRVRSKYFDPRSRDQREKPAVILNADNRDFNVGPIYPPGSPTDGAGLSEPLFEYFVELTMPDGRTYRSTRWTPSDNLRVLIGRAQLEGALGSLPPPPPESAPAPSPTPSPSPFFYGWRGL